MDIEQRMATMLDTVDSQHTMRECRRPGVDKLLVPFRTMVLYPRGTCSSTAVSANSVAVFETAFVEADVILTN
jgi:hypothetical protein